MSEINRPKSFTKKRLMESIQKGVFWSSVKIVMVRSLSLIQLFILARLLTPLEFGAFGLAMLVVNFTEAMSYIGFKQAIIQMKSVQSDTLNTLFVVNILRGMVLGAVILLCATPVSQFMGSPESAHLIAAICVYPIITGFNNPALTMLQRDLDLKKDTIFHLSGSVPFLVVSVIIAIYSPTAWAIFGGLLAQILSQLVMSYWLNDFMPSIEFSKVQFKKMFGFGGWLTIANILKYFSGNLPLWVITSILGVASLGIYQIAGKLSQTIGTELNKMITTLLFPSFSFLNEDGEALGKLYLTSQKIISSISFLVFGVLFVLSERIVDILLLEIWSPAAPVMAVLALLCLLQSLGSQVEIINAAGRTRFTAYIAMLRVIPTACLVVPFVNTWGLLGAVSLIVLITATTWLVSMMEISRLIGLGLGKLLIIYVPQLLAFIIMVITLRLLDRHFPESLLSLIGLAAISVMIFSLALYLLDRVLKIGIVNEIKKLSAAEKFKESNA